MKVELAEVIQTAFKSAKKYVLTEPIFDKPHTIEHVKESNEHPVSEAAWFLEGVKKIHTNENFLVVHLTDSSEFEDFEAGLKRILKAYDWYPPNQNDPSHSEYEELIRQDTTPEEKAIIQAVDQIWQQEVYPTLMKDGGGLEIITLQHQVLYIRFTGTCTSCSFSKTGTLDLIKKTTFTHFPHIQIHAITS